MITREENFYEFTNRLGKYLENKLHLYDNDTNFNYEKHKETCLKNRLKRKKKCRKSKR
jgi:hypothetical protein